MNPESAVEKVSESGAFGALSVILLMLIWWLIREQNRKDDLHTAQIERINAAHDDNIEKVTIQFTTQIDKMSVMAQADRKESTEAFNKLSNLLSSVIEKRGAIELQERYKQQ
jgi:predicted PurR-regulated permease PerM